MVSQDQFRDYFNQAPIGMIITSPEGIFIEANQAYCDILGYTHDELAHIDPLSLTHPDDRRENTRLHQELLEGKRRSFIFEKRNRRKDGSTVRLRVHSTLHRDAQGRPLHIIGVVEEISGRTAVQDGVQTGEEQLKAMLKSIVDEVWIVDAAGNVLWVNDAVQKNLGAEPGRWSNIAEAIKDLEIFYPDGTPRPPERTPLHRALNGESLNKVEEIVRNISTGERRWREVSAAPIHDAHGNITGAVCIARDITEHKHAEIQLKELAQRYATVLESSTDCIQFFDHNWTITFINRRAEQTLGMENMIGKNIWELFPEAVGSKFYLEYHRALQENVPVHFVEFYPPLGMWLEINAYPSAEGLGVYFRDITERKRADDALRESEQRLRATFDHAAMGIVEVDKAGRFLAVNNRACTILGYSRDELLALTVHDLTAPEDRARSDELNAQLNAGTMARLEYEKRYLRKDGTPLWVHVKVSAVRDSAGRFLHAIGTIEDIDERKRAETDLMQSNARLKVALDAGEMGVWDVDLVTGEITANERMRRIFGVGDRMHRSDFIEHIHPDDLPHVNETLQNAEMGGSSYSLEFRILNPDGTVRWALTHGMVITDDAGHPARRIGVTQDITERKSAELERERLVELLSEAVSDANTNRSQLEAVFEAMQDGVMVFDMHGNAVLVNEAEARICGYQTAAEMKQNLRYFSKVFNLMSADGSLLPIEEWPISKVMRGESITDWELRGRRTDTKQEWYFSFSGEPVYDEENKQVLAVIITRDITERKRVEEQARQFRERLEIAQRAAKIGNWDTDVQTGRIWWSSETYRIYGIPEGTQIMLEQFFDFIHPDDRETVKAHAAKARTGEGVYEIDHRIVLPDGEIRHVHEHGQMFFSPEGKPCRMVGIVQDITGRKHAEEELQRTRELLEEAQRIAKLGSWENDLRTWKLRWSPETYAIFGIPEGTPLNTDQFLEMVHPDDRQPLMELSMKARKGEAVFDMDHRIIHPDGNVHYVHEQAKVIFDADGVAERMIGTVQDITARKEMEHALRESEQLFRELADAMPQIVWSSRPDGTVDYYNQQWYEFTGLDASLIGDDSWSPIVHPDDAARISASWHDSIKTGKPYEIECRYKDRRTATYRWFLARALPIRDTSGKIIRWFGTSTDIDDQKRSQAALLESEERFRMIAEASPNIVWTAQPDGNVDYYNVRWEEYSGIKRTEGHGWGWAPVVHPEDEAATNAAWTGAVKTGEVYQIEHRIRRHDGQFRWFLSRGIALRDDAGNIIKWFGTATDIHDSKIAQQAILESEEKFRLLTETIPQLVWTCDSQGMCDYANQQHTIYTGLSMEQTLGRGWIAAVHPDDAAQIFPLWTIASQRKESFDMEYRLRQADGEYRWFAVHANPVLDSRGEIIKWVGTCTDIHNQRRATDNLKFVAHINDIVGQSLEHGERLDNLASGCVPYLADWCIIELITPEGSVERAAVANADSAKAAAVRDASQKFPLHLSDRCAIAQILAEGRPRLYQDVDEQALRDIARNDEHLAMIRQQGLCSLMIVPLIARGKTLGAVLLLYSTSGRRYTQEDLSFAQEVVHRFAIGIDNSMLYNNAKAALSLRDDFLSIASHELKTPVTSIKAFLQALEQRMRNPGRFDFAKNTEYMQLSIKQVDRLASLINDLLDINRINKGTMEYHFSLVPLGPMIAEVVERMSVSFPTHKMICKLQDLRTKVRIDPLRLEQALTNIITNAVKYSPEGSTIEIVTRTEEQVMITITDRGMGIAPELQKHIFDPYYRTPGAITTRAGGLGVGLFISLQLIKAHGGTLSVHSEIGKGSTFTISLPCVHE